jgi:tetratricopeptide (TPR) repeat protein
MRYLSILLLLSEFASPAIWAQGNVHQQLYQAYALEQQGQFDRAIHVIQPILDSHTLGFGENGRAWTLLGYAYEEQWNFERAQNAYEQAVRIFEGDSHYLGDYANVLDLFAGLYSDMRQPQMAAKMYTKALSIHGQLGDHRGLVRTYTALAENAIEQNNMRSAKESLAKALGESNLTSELTDDDHAFLSDIQAWMAIAKGDKNAAIAQYQHSLDLMRHSHGEDYPLTGFAHLLVGKAYAANKQFNEALTSMREGISILNRTVGPQSPRYLEGQILYAEVLDRSGLHAEASRLKAAAQQSLRGLYGGQCAGCTVSVATLR